MSHQYTWSPFGPCFRRSPRPLRNRQPARRRRHGRGVSRDGHASRTGGGHQGSAGRRHRVSADPGTLPAGSASRLGAQPPQHLHDLRRRHRSAVHRDGTARRRDAPAAAHARPDGRAGPRRHRPAPSPMPWMPRTARASSIATSSRRTSSSRRAGRRFWISGWRRRRPDQRRSTSPARPTRSVRGAADRSRQHGGDGVVHVAGAGPRAAVGRPHGSVLVRRGALRNGDGHAAISRGQPGSHFRAILNRAPVPPCA